MTTAVASSFTATPYLDRWLVRDLLATAQAAAIADLRLDTPLGGPVPPGLASLAAGRANGRYWRTLLGTGGVDTSEPIVRYHRASRIEIEYHAAHAVLGEQLTLRSEGTSSQLSTTIEGAAGLIATVRQTRAERPVTEESVVVAAASDSAADEELARVRIARWVYLAGELEVVHGNHVTATEAGLPAALVPESFLALLLERRLGSAESGLRRLTIEVDKPVAAGGWVRLEPSDASSLNIFSTEGVVGRAHRE